MATPMTDEQRRDFLTHGTRTAVLATVGQDGRPHAAPVWFVLDGDAVIFMTGRGTVKGRNLLRTGQVALAVDDAAPPYSFVSMRGGVTLSEDLDEMLDWSIKIARRYMGDGQAEAYGRRNAVPGELLVRFEATTTVATADLAE